MRKVPHASKSSYRADNRKTVINKGVYNVLGVGIHAVDYEYAVTEILNHARQRKPYAVSALAVHGVMTGHGDQQHKYRLNHLDLVSPDGQPVRWAIQWLHGVTLPDRVYGPFLTLKTCEAAAEAGLSIFCFGSSEKVLSQMVKSLRQRFPQLKIAGTRPSRFRRATKSEIEGDCQAILESGASIVLVGLGCPRQEVWAYEMRDRLSMPILAVGAAFDFIAGNLPMAPKWMQNTGLEWFYRLIKEPYRLWKRYLLLNPAFVWALAKSKSIKTSGAKCAEIPDHIGYG